MIHIAICDNSKKDLLQLKEVLIEVLNDFPIHYTITAFERGDELIDSPILFQLVFLDMEMDSRQGIEIGQKIYRRNKAVKIIYHANIKEHLLEAINKTHAFAFLEKPIQRATAEEQIKEFIEFCNTRPEILVEFKNVSSMTDNKEVEIPMLHIATDSIIYFEYLKSIRKIKIIAIKGVFIISETMNVLEERMRPLGFETCCRGILVNLSKIENIESVKVFL